MTAIPWSEAQRAAIETEGRDLLATAGAGTGKTSVLIERILYKLRRGSANLDQLLVVTFTEKAAQEMRKRLAGELSRDPALREHLLQLPRAHISTIDSFCLRLLREQFVEAGLEPGFHVLDENAQVEAVQEALRHAFHLWYGRSATEEGKRFQSLIELTGFEESGEVLRRNVQRLYAFSRVHPDPEAYLESLISRPPATRLEDLPWHGEMRRQLQRAWTRGLERYDEALGMAEAAGKKTDRHRLLCASLRAFTPAAMADPAARGEFVQRMTDGGLAVRDPEFVIKFPNAPGGMKEVPGFSLCHEGAKVAFAHPSVRSLPWDQARLLREDEEQRKELRVLVALVREMEAHYQAYKQRRGALDFSDLEIQALRFLEGPGAGPDLAESFREVLVDEFQDVNALQDRILSLLSRPDGRFRVGDVKQSIYQFRLADPGIFLALAEGRTELKKPAGVPAGSDPLIVFFSENHRSRPAVLRLVNHVFARLFAEDLLGSTYDKQRLLDRRPEAAGNPPLELHLVDKAGDETHTALELQARVTALRIGNLVRNEGTRIPDKQGVEHPARWRDVVVLLRSRTRAEVFVKALQAEGIPVSLAQGETLSHEEPVRDFLALLQIVDNPRDDVSLAAALRSPIFCISDADLLRLRLAWPGARSLLDAAAAAAYEDDPAAEGGVFWPPEGAAVSKNGESEAAPSDPGAAAPEAPAGLASLPIDWTGARSENPDEFVPPALRRRLREILDRLRGWRALEPRQELGQFIGFLLEDARLPAILRGRGRRTREMAGLEKLLSLARAYETERGPSLHGFLARLRDLEAAGEVYGVPRNAEDEDAVTILTVHKAKGLEFPIVVLPHLDWARPRDRLGSNVIIGPQWVGIRHLDFEAWARRETSARRVLEEQQREEGRAEEARVFYVALTRARERLILIGSAPADLELDEPLPAVAVKERLDRSRSALDWLLAVLPWERAQAMAPAAAATSTGEGSTVSAREWLFSEFPLRVHTHPREGISWPNNPSPDESDEDLRDRIRRGLPLPPARRAAGPREEQAAEEAGRELNAILERASAPDRFPPLARLFDLKGKYWVTEFKQPSDRSRADDLDAEGAAVWSLAPAGSEEAALEGTRYHAALARLDLREVTSEGLSRQMEAFAAAPWWGGAGRDLALEAGLAACFRTPELTRLSDCVRAGGELHRESAFTLKWPVLELAAFRPDLGRVFQGDPRWQSGPWADALANAWVLLQGRMDCLFRDQTGWTVVDWKTDRVSGAGLAARAAAYGPQMRLYREAASRLWGAPVRALLAFVRAGVVFSLE